MKGPGDVAAFISGQPEMRLVLEAVSVLGLPDAWVAAGFIRNAIWDALHGRPPASNTDIDVIFFDADDPSPDRDERARAMLAAMLPGLPWSVKNQARMHLRNSDPPYADSLDAMRRWPEPCTAIAMRWSAGGVELAAPFGVTDLIGLVVRPTPAFRAKPESFRRRMAEKQWPRRWPGLRVTEAGTAARDRS